MANAYSNDDLLDFLTHASDRGLIPAATASALAVAVRNVFGVLTEDERQDVSHLDLAGVIKRFTNKRARDFNPSSLTEYGRRVQRAIDLYEKWRDDPANFSIKTRATKAAAQKHKGAKFADNAQDMQSTNEAPIGESMSGTAYSSSVPIRTDWVVTVTNIPADLTASEAERLAKFIRMLAVD